MTVDTLTFNRVTKNLSATRCADMRLFIDTGEASQEFLTWLDTDSEAQRVVEQLFGISCTIIDKLVVGLAQRRQRDTKKIFSLATMRFTWHRLGLNWFKFCHDVGRVFSRSLRLK